MPQRWKTGLQAQTDFRLHSKRTWGDSYPSRLLHSPRNDGMVIRYQLTTTHLLFCVSASLQEASPHSQELSTKHSHFSTHRIYTAFLHRSNLFSLPTFIISPRLHRRSCFRPPNRMMYHGFQNLESSRFQIRNPRPPL